MGLFDKIKEMNKQNFDKIEEMNKQNEETDISKMKFWRSTGLVGCVPQKFADTSIPVCPMCKQSSMWTLHNAGKILKMFPITKQEDTLHIKCEHCGLVMHTVFHIVNGNEPDELTNPSPRNNITMMTIDVVGNKAENFDLAGKEMSIWELNQLV